MTKLAEMKEALEAATPWPWHFVSYSVGSHDVVYAANDDFVCSTAQAEDAHLIANAPEWLAKLITVAEAAEELVRASHYEAFSSGPVVNEGHVVSVRKALEALK